MTETGAENLAARVGAAEAFWRERRRQLDQWLKLLADQGWPESHMQPVLRHARAERERWCGELLARFGLDMENLPTPGDGPIQELDTADYDDFIVTFVNANYWDEADKYVQRTYDDAIREGALDIPE